MKRLFTLFVIVCALVGNAWGARKLYFEYQVIEDPTLTDGYYQQPLMWIWDDASTGDDGKPYNMTANGFDGDCVWTVTTTGDLTITSGHYQTQIDAHNYVISDSKIYITGNSGTIKVTATRPDFGGETYSCSYLISFGMSSKKWSFYSKKMAIGRYQDEGSDFRQWCDDNQWTHDVSGDPVYWYNYSNIDGDISKYSTFGRSSGGTFFIEAEGLIFTATANTFGMHNENDSVDVAASDRFIALKKGASVKIPKKYFHVGFDESKAKLSHPRIRIKMGRYGGTDPSHPQINLTITNVKDAHGTAITEYYIIGGSAWWGDKKDNHQRGEYHFIVDNENKDEDVTITVADGQFLKLYSIEVYNSETMITENAVLGTNYQLLTGSTIPASRATGRYYLHYRGKGEHTHVVTNVKSGDANVNYCRTGIVDAPVDRFSGYDGAVDHTYTATSGQFGTFQIRLDCYTLDGKYCTDYADRSQSVGYFDKQTYPCTWDFTDVAKYAYSGDAMYWEGQYNDVAAYNGRSSWKIISGEPGPSCRCGHQLSWDASGHDVVFCGGSQLWCGKQVLPEIAGIGFTPSNFSSSYNNSLQLLPSGNYYQIGDKYYHGIKINQNQTSWWCYRITVPAVPNGGAVYARVHPLPTTTSETPTEDQAKYPIAGYTYGDYKKPVVKNNVTIDAGNVNQAIGTGATKVIDTNDDTGDKIYVIPGTSESESSNVTLYFNGVIIEKIAVSTDKKEFNAKGWTTESRDHDIDPSLTAEMNGRGIKTFAVTYMKYDKKKVVMTDISNAGLMHAATDESKYACILRNTEDAELSVVNGGFYLFVPDMHDEQGENTGDGYRLKNYAPSMESSIMKAKVSYAYPANYPNYGDNASGTPIPAKSDDGTITNFAFTYQYCQLNSSGEAYGTLQEGHQAFYRIATNGGYSKGNQGYLPLLTSEVTKNTAITSGTRGYELSFGDDEEGGETTDIETIVNGNDLTGTTHRTYYSLSGQQLNGKPAKGGIYICNGKKIVIK